MILLDRVTKTYPGDGDPVLDNISLHIDPHEFVFLVGKSGAGKSTLIKMITKEEEPDSGKIIIGGIDLDYIKRRHVPHYRRRLGVVFQDYKLLPTRTVFENVAFALEIAGASNREIERTVPKVLDLVGLENKANKFPTHLSGGERQRVSIARSVARQPKILIADEPTGNLDKLTKTEIIELLQRINDLGTTLLVTTHDESIVNNLSKRVITLKAGKIVDDQKLNGVYRLDSEPEPTEQPEPKIIHTPIIQRIIAMRPRGNARPVSYSTQVNNQPQSKATLPPLKPAEASPFNGAVRSTKPSPKLSAKPAPSSSKLATPKPQPTAPKLPATKNTSTLPTKAPAKTSTKPSDTKPKANPKSSSTEKPANAPKPAAPAKKYDRDSANQWYAASKPLRAAPKLSNLSLGQTVKLKPAPSIKQAIKKSVHPGNQSHGAHNNKPKQKRII